MMWQRYNKKGKPFQVEKKDISTNNGEEISERKKVKDLNSLPGLKKQIKKNFHKPAPKNQKRTARRRSTDETGKDFTFLKGDMWPSGGGKIRA